MSTETPPIEEKTASDLLPELILLDSEEFCKLFDICMRTAFKWRRDGIIAYIRIQGRLYYRLSDVLETMNKFSNKNHNN